MEAIVIGGGIGGLCAAIGLRRRGWRVSVLERVPEFREVGAGITLMANGLRGLDALGVGDAVRGAGSADAAGGTRTPSGRWISRIDGAALTAVLGTAAIGIHRAALHEVLRAALPAESLVTGAEVLDVSTGVTYRHRGVTVTRDAALVIGADGIDSTVRARLWPAHPAPVYSGSTAWRGVTARPWDGERVAAITWGPGAEFGMVPLGDGRVYWYGAVNAPAGLRVDDELAAMRARFGGWHAPVSDLLDATDPAAVIRTDLRHLAAPLSSYAADNVALLGDAAHAMLPNLGQGANQAIEDAAVLASVCAPGEDVEASLRKYDRLRRPRSQQVARAAAQICRFGQQLTNPVAIALRDTLMRLTPARVALRSMARYASWDAPDIPRAAGTD
ncbi:FAD-dependent monooxygenase [Luedemannella helvata]|uniref:FAD-dependent monooxygenase n=1 Tax=Luedemannella helvata TaxID=349315 RepID=A0ABP4VXP8_9ACTN